MKKKFSKILGIGLTLSLLFSLLLTAAPVSADVSEATVEVTPDEISVAGKYTITFDVNEELGAAYRLYEGSLGSATWSEFDATDSDPANPDLDDDLGSVLLTHDAGTGSVYVDVAPPSPPAIKFSAFAGDPTTYSFKHYVALNDTGNGPQFELRFEDPDSTGWLEVTAVGLQGYTGTGNWVLETLATTTLAGFGGNTPDGSSVFDWSPLTPLSAILTDVNTAWGAAESGKVATDYVLTRVRVELWEATAPDSYIDDIVIASGTALGLDDDAGAGTISIEFPEDTVVADGWASADVTVQSTAGFGDSNSETDVGLACVTTEDNDVYTVTIGLGQLAKNIGEGATVRVKFLGDQITNPSDPGTYTLEVKTSEETDAVTSESYAIDAPIVGGFVYVYNPSGILMATFGGSAALNYAHYPTDYYAKEGFTIKVGPGTYVLNNDIEIKGKNVTLESSDGAADTIIDAKTGADYYTISITTNKGITIDGFTIDDADEAIIINYEDAIVTNCVITDASVAGIQIEAGGIDATVSDNVIEDCAIGINFVVMDPTTVDLGDVDITGNTITETSGNGGIVFGGGNQDIDITGNTITGNDDSGIYFDDNTTNAFVCDDITISGNTITLNEGSGIEIAEDEDAQAPTKLVITENDILDNEVDGILIASWEGSTCYIMFNNIHDNTDDAVENLDTDVGDEVNARFNWWGTAVEDDFDDELVGDVDYEPWLAGTWESVVSGSKVATDASSLDAKTAADVKVSGVDDGAKLAAVISAAKYIANPEGAIADAIAFYDVFVLLETDFDVTDVTAKLKFYDGAITTGSVAHFWTGDFWALCSDMEARDGIIYVSVSDDTLPALDELEETIFAVVAGEAVTEFGAPELLTPIVGDDTVSLTPTFAWGAVTGADGYYFEFADNANFVTPLVKLDGDLGRLIVTAYAYVTELPYSTAYYWRVKAVSGTEAAGDLAESPWTSGVFITMAEPEEAIPPVVIEPYEPPEIVIEQPDIIVPLPAETPITPAWIYVIIGVGAVLVIGLIVLIVRTRRVA